MKVLIIEDSEATAAVISDMVKQFYATVEHEILTAHTAADAREMIDDADIVLLDLNLPDSPPEKTISELIRKDRPTVVVSGTDDHEVVTRTIDAGATGYWIKGGSAQQFAVELLRATACRERRSKLATELIAELEKVK